MVVNTTMITSGVMNFSLISPTDAPCCNDQCDLATGDHTNTDLQALLVGVTHDLCAQTAANHLGDNRQQHQQKHEYYQLFGQTLQRHGETDVGKEDGGEEHIRQGVETIYHVLILFQSGYCQTGNKCAGDVCYAKANSATRTAAGRKQRSRCCGGAGFRCWIHAIS